MKKILLSLFSIGVVAIVAVFATQAFFNDTETSTGNVLVAGALDLKIDNTCYYNGQACLPTGEEPEAPSTLGGSPDGVPCSCTWELKDLGQGDVFFSFRDLKPGDWEEDTISLHVDNPSWVCASAKLTKDDDNTCTEPELVDDPTCTDPGAPGNADSFDGELAENLHFVFWNDDGDNVLEEGETVIRQGEGADTLGGDWVLADSSTGQPIAAGQNVFIGKAFCFGTLGLAPVAPGDNTPVGPIANSGITCDGKPVNNASQTDLVTGDVVFTAVQARHNEQFLCEGAKPNGN